MQRTGILARVSHSLVLCGVPALALIWFGPDAWSAASKPAAAPGRLLAGTTVSSLNHVVPAELLDWHETDSATKILVAEAHRNSAALNNAVRSSRLLLATVQSQKPGSLDSALILQSLLLAVAQRDAWDSNWRQVGRRGADLRLLGRSLVDLRVEFIAANVSLQSLQVQERAAASVFSYTPPAF